MWSPRVKRPLTEIGGGGWTEIWEVGDILGTQNQIRLSIFGIKKELGADIP